MSRGKGKGSPNITMKQIKSFISMRITNREWKFLLFWKMTNVAYTFIPRNGNKRKMSMQSVNMIIKRMTQPIVPYIKKGSRCSVSVYSQRVTKSRAIIDRWLQKIQSIHNLNNSHHHRSMEILNMTKMRKENEFTFQRISQFSN